MSPTAAKEAELAKEMQSMCKDEDDDGQKSFQASCLRITTGYAVGFMGILLLALGVVCAQALGGVVPPFELNGFRYVAQFVIVTPVLLFKWLSILPERNELLWLTLTTICSVTFNLSYYTAATYLPVGTVGGVQPSLIIVFAAAVTLILDRKCSYHIMIASGICVVGVLLITQPSVFFKGGGNVVYHPVCGPLSHVSHPGQFLPDNTTIPTYTLRDAIQEYNSESTNTSLLPEEKSHPKRVQAEIGYICLLGAAVTGCALFFIVNRNLQGMSGFAISFWVSVAGILTQFLIMPFAEKPTFPKRGSCIALLLGHGFGAGGGFVSLVFAGQMVMPAVMSLLNTLEVLLLFGAEYTFLRGVYPGRGNWLEIVGAVFVLAGNIIDPAIKLHAHFKQNYYNPLP